MPILCEEKSDRCPTGNSARPHYWGHAQHCSIVRSSTRFCWQSLATLLAELGNRIELFVIQGELFSGSADPLVNPVREAPVDYILLDFRNVSGAASATI